MRSKLASFITIFLLQASLSVADKKVPGDNPLSFCSEKPADDILQINEVTLIPNPPVRGKDLKVKAEGHLKQTLKEDDGSLHFTSWNGTKLVDDESFELCEGLELFDQECPIEAGHLSVSQDIPLWEEEDLPEGTFYAQINITTAQGQQITCFGGEFTL